MFLSVKYTNPVYLHSYFCHHYYEDNLLKLKEGEYTIRNVDHPESLANRRLTSCWTSKIIGGDKL